MTIKRSFSNIKIGGDCTITKTEADEQIAAQDAKRGTPEAEKLKRVIVLSKSIGAQQSNPIDPGFFERYLKGEPFVNRIIGDPWEGKGEIHVNDFAFLPQDIELK